MVALALARQGDDVLVVTDFCMTMQLIEPIHVHAKNSNGTTVGKFSIFIVVVSRSSLSSAVYALLKVT